MWILRRPGRLATAGALGALLIATAVAAASLGGGGSTRTHLRLLRTLRRFNLRPYDFEVSGDPRTYADLATAAGSRQVARYADGVGPSKDYIVPRSAAASSLAPYGRALAEYEQFFRLGVDGLFSDNPDTAAEARSSFVP
jgi:glycerophosphoryl diester phosphodiesterase